MCNTMPNTPQPKPDSAIHMTLPKARTSRFHEDFTTVTAAYPPAHSISPSKTPCSNRNTSAPVPFWKHILCTASWCLGSRKHFKSSGPSLEQDQEPAPQTLTCVVVAPVPHKYFVAPSLSESLDESVGKNSDEDGDGAFSAVHIGTTYFADVIQLPGTVDVDSWQEGVCNCEEGESGDLAHGLCQGVVFDEDVVEEWAMLMDGFVEFHREDFERSVKE